MTPAASEADSDEQSRDGGSTPHPSPRLSDADGDVAALSAAVGNFRLPAAASLASGADRPEKVEDYDALHSAVDIDKLYPKDGEELGAGLMVEEKKHEAKVGRNGKEKDVSEETMSMSIAASETVGRLMPLVVATNEVGAEDTEPSADSGAHLKPLLDQYAVSISRVTSRLDEEAVPVMQAQGYEVVGGLDGMVDRARVVALFDEHGVPVELVDALQGSMPILERLESEVTVLEMVTPGLTKHRAILHALRSCLEMLKRSS